ncbi:Uncharacterised protein [Mycobacterium tuberculosis]|nr:Uncharacterised protein [Mycobacterium tuberculosis]CKM91414.1 Uncharacterised protein [Mycobacterium tuberculosis]CKN14496.1 Uncharacterised protein [Mycobacterium tuberculosis]CKQ17429.1 Uncharacterised protein [Mycobacterium tuberculosis]CKQ98849.1 Uncharacterised protein [Mycobacterium tuberculosis]
MQCHQRRRTRGIHRHRRALQAQHIRHPPGGHAQRRATQPVALQVTRHPALAPIRAVEHPGEHARLRTPQRDWVDARPLQRFPRHFQQQPLLGIHRKRLAGCDPEKLGVKTGDIRQEPAAPGIRLAYRVGIGVKQPRHIPAAIRRELRNRVTAVCHQLPQRLRRIHPTRIAASHPHHRHRLGGPGKKIPVLSLQSLVLLERSAQGLDEVFGSAVHGTRSAERNVTARLRSE